MLNPISDCVVGEIPSCGQRLFTHTHTHHAQINQTTTTKWRFYTTEKRNVIFLRDNSAQPYTTVVPNIFSNPPPKGRFFILIQNVFQDIPLKKNWMDI
jgi:hypothetical protein